MTCLIIFHGHSYPYADFQAVVDVEARQGRTVTIAIQHAGGWAVAGEASPDVAQDELTEYLWEHAAQRAKGVCRYCKAKLSSEKVRLHLRICDACLPEAWARFREFTNALDNEQKIVYNEGEIEA